MNKQYTMQVKMPDGTMKDLPVIDTGAARSVTVPDGYKVSDVTPKNFPDSKVYHLTGKGWVGVPDANLGADGTMTLKVYDNNFYSYDWEPISDNGGARLYSTIHNGYGLQPWMQMVGKDELFVKLPDGTDLNTITPDKYPNVHTIFVFHNCVNGGDDSFSRDGIMSLDKYDDSYSVQDLKLINNAGDTRLYKRGSTSNYFRSWDRYDGGNKQDKLTAGDNITIVDNVISAAGGGGGGGSTLRVEEMTADQNGWLTLKSTGKHIHKDKYNICAVQVSGLYMNLSTTPEMLAAVEDPYNTIFHMENITSETPNIIKCEGVQFTPSTNELKPLEYCEVLFKFDIYTNELTREWRIATAGGGSEVPGTVELEQLYVLLEDK